MKSEVARLVAVLIAAYPGARIAPENTTKISGAYESTLEDLDYPTANAAVEQLLATCKFLPTIAEIREAAMSLNVGERRAGGEAWGDVIRAIARYGRNRIPGADFEVSDPVTLACIRALSWCELCDSENRAADRARFIELYEQLAVQHRRRALSEGLPAMQRLRVLQEARRDDEHVLRSGEPRTFAQVLQLVRGAS